MRELEGKSASMSSKCCFSCMFVSIAMPGGFSLSFAAQWNKFSQSTSMCNFSETLCSANCLNLLLWAPCLETGNPLFCLLNVHSQSQVLLHKHHVPAWLPSRGYKILCLDSLSGFSHFMVSSEFFSKVYFWVCCSSPPFCLLPREFKGTHWFRKLLMPLIWLLFLDWLW